MDDFGNGIGNRSLGGVRTLREFIAKVNGFAQRRGGKFQRRIRFAYCMNEDDAGSLVSGGIGKFKGIEKPNCAVFVNRMTNESIWFRPYFQGDLQ